MGMSHKNPTHTTMKTAFLSTQISHSPASCSCVGWSCRGACRPARREAGGPPCESPRLLPACHWRRCLMFSGKYRCRLYLFSRQMSRHDMTFRLIFLRQISRQDTTLHARIKEYFSARAAHPHSTVRMITRLSSYGALVVAQHQGCL